MTQFRICILFLLAAISFSLAAEAQQPKKAGQEPSLQDYESSLATGLKLYEEVVQVLESVQDEKTAQAAIGKLREIEKKKDQLPAVGTPPEDVRKALAPKYEARMRAAVEKLGRESFRMQTEERFLPVWDELSAALARGAAARPAPPATPMEAQPAKTTSHAKPVTKLLELKDHNDLVWDADFSFDGKTLASCSSDKTIRLWDVASGNLKKTIDIHARSVRFLRDGKTIAAHVLEHPDDLHGILLIDLASGKAQKMMFVQSGNDKTYFTAATVSPSGNLVCAGSTALGLWKMPGAEFKGSFPIAESDFPDRNVAVSADGKRAATGDGRIWNLATGKQIGETIESLYQQASRNIAFSPDSKTVAFLPDNFGAVLCDANTGAELRKISFGSSGSMQTLAYAPSGKFIAVSGYRKIEFFDVKSGDRLADITTEKQIGILSLVFSPDGTRLAICGSGESKGDDATPAIEIWDVSAFAEKNVELAQTPAPKVSTTGSERKLRNWTSADGKFNVEAQFVRLLDDQVELKTKDGRTLKVPLAKLSERDRDYATSPD